MSAVVSISSAATDATPVVTHPLGILTGLSRSVRRLLAEHPWLRAAALAVVAQARSLQRAPPGIYTLCYHHVSREAAAGFAAQLALMARHGRFVGADEALNHLRSGRPVLERLFVLTFDDGYRDTVEVAMPEVLRQGIPAMLFLVSDWLDAPPDDGQSYATRADVARWVAAGLDIGSHTASHRRLSRLPDDEVAAEMGRSAMAIAALLRRPALHFACPWGVAHIDYRPDRDTALAAGAGYATFFTTRRGRAIGAAAAMDMPRHVLEPEWGLFYLHALMGRSPLGKR